MKSIPKTCVVIPNLNGLDSLQSCLDSLKNQTFKTDIIVVENASTDGSADWLTENYPDITVLPQTKNLGFAGGVNAGIRYALAAHYEFIALFNNDAVAKADWLENLVSHLEQSDKTGIATGTFMTIDEQHLDSTGDIYTTWGLPFPRGRGEPADHSYQSGPVFGASGGASLYRSAMFENIGLFDEDFFAYYEDVDISFRAQLAGWTVTYVAEAIAYHQIGQTSSKIKGFTTKQTIKNYPWLLIKNVPSRFLPTILPRFLLAYLLFVISAIARGHLKYAAQGLVLSVSKLPKKLRERRHIQTNRKVGDDYIWNLMTHDLPPNAHKLRKLRSLFWKLNKKRT